MIIFQIYSESFSNKDAGVVKGSFTIDKTLGRDVEIEITYKVPSTTTLSFRITYPNGTEIDPTIPKADKIYIYEFGSAPLEV